MRCRHVIRRGYVEYMDENRARRVVDARRDRGVNAHAGNAGIDVYGVRVVLGGFREEPG